MSIDTYYKVNGEIFKFKDNEFIRPQRFYLGIKDWVIIDKDGTFKGKEVHTGDMILTFYDENYTELILPVDNEYTAKFLEVFLKKEEEYKKGAVCSDANPSVSSIKAK